MARIYRLEHKSVKPKKYPDTPTFISVYDSQNILYSSTILDDDYLSESEKSKWDMLKNTYDRLIGKHNDGDYRPTPCQDGIDFEFDREFCGSPSIDALAEWFEFVFDDFLKLGFVVREYIVDSTKIGDSGLQCVARYSEVKKSKIVEINLVD